MAQDPARRLQRVALAILFIGATAAALLWQLQRSNASSSLETLALAARWLAILGAVLLGFARRSLTTWILISMIAGAAIGHDFPSAAGNLRVLGLVFLRLIKTIIAPLLFGTLVVGIAGHADLKKVGRMGVKALIYFEVVTTLALFIGLAAINISKAGVGVQLPPPAPGEQIAVPQHQSASDIILHIFPENIAKSVAEGQILQVVIFSILFAVALSLISEAKRRPMIAFCESLSEVMFKFTNIIMLFAPIGVGAAIAYTVSTSGAGVLTSLAKLLVTFYVAIFVFVLLVLLPVALLAKIPLKKFAAAIAEPVSIAFATTSSEAALPRAMEALEGLGIPRQIVAFVMPTGYSFNLDGATMYLSMATLFVAQSAGIHLTFGQQLVIMFTLMLTSKGVAGVPRASLVILLGTVASFHLPTEPVFILLGIDALMDMGRTSLNVIGNCLATAVVARWEGEYGTAVPSPAVRESLNG
jgi:proton glutamate symport protein